MGHGSSIRIVRASSRGRGPRKHTNPFSPPSNQCSPHIQIIDPSPTCLLQLNPFCHPSHRNSLTSVQTLSTHVVVARVVSGASAPIRCSRDSSLMSSQHRYALDSLLVICMHGITLLTQTAGRSQLINTAILYVEPIV
jgi:hypothetical protein